MPNKKILLLAAMLLITACQEKTPSTEVGNEPTVAGATTTAKDFSSAVNEPLSVLSDAQLKVIVKNVMADQYGEHYDAKNDCWEHLVDSQGDSISYCMKPSAVKQIDTKKGKVIYFYAANRADINDDSRYAYSSVNSGLMGAFKLAVDSSGSWKYFSASKAMDSGSGGYCGCDNADFVKLGNDDYYGWHFTSGGVWQGIVVSNHEIIAPHGDSFKNLSSIPEVREDEQDISYELKVVNSDENKKAFPLLVTKIKSGAKAEELLVRFDEKEWLYSLPKNF